LPYLFDTDAISEVLRRRPAPGFMAWLARIPRTEQYTSAVVVGELFEGAHRSTDPRHLEGITARILPAITVLPYDVAVARVYGAIQAGLAARGRTMADSDAMIAATAAHHGLSLVTRNLRHFERVAGLRVERILAETRGTRRR